MPRPLVYEGLLDVMVLTTGDPPDDAEVLRLRAAAQAGDAEAAFRVGVAAVQRLPRSDWDQADAWFELAVELGGSAWAWLATDAYAHDMRRYRRWMARAIEADYPLPEAPGIHVAPDTVGPVDDEDPVMRPLSACFQVAETTDEILAGLAAAAPRLGLVDERGREYATEEELDDLTLGEDAPRAWNGEALATAYSYPEPFTDDPRGPYLLTDTASAMWGPMARTMIRIVVDELIEAGVAKAHIGPYRPAGT